MKILLLGARGQLGTDLLKTNPGHTITSHVQADADINDEKALQGLLDKAPPQVVINTVAYNRTEDAEAKTDLAFSVNTLGPRLLSRLCAERKIRLLHYSTDFVFNGAKGTPYVESDLPAPLNIYGLSKWGGEQMVLASDPNNWVIRTASLFGVAGSSGKGGNFVESIISSAQAGKPLQIVSNIFMSPTYARDLAERTWLLIGKTAPGGLYHVTNDGPTSWHGFAQEIISQMGLKTSISSRLYEDNPTRMKRPSNTVLASERWKALGLGPLRPWAEALRVYLTEKNHL